MKDPCPCRQCDRNLDALLFHRRLTVVLSIILVVSLFTLYKVSHIRDTKHRMHPLIMLFDNARVSHIDGMNALQDGPLRLISDNCVTIGDVPYGDAREAMMHARWAKQS